MTAAIAVIWLPVGTGNLQPIEHTLGGGRTACFGRATVAVQDRD